LFPFSVVSPFIPHSVSSLSPYTTLFRSIAFSLVSFLCSFSQIVERSRNHTPVRYEYVLKQPTVFGSYVLRPSPSQIQICEGDGRDRKSTRLNSSHVSRSYALFCFKKKIT